LAEFGVVDGTGVDQQTDDQGDQKQAQALREQLVTQDYRANEITD